MKPSLLLLLVSSSLAFAQMPSQQFTSGNMQVSVSLSTDAAVAALKVCVKSPDDSISSYDTQGSVVLANGDSQTFAVYIRQAHGPLGGNREACAVVFATIATLAPVGLTSFSITAQRSDAPTVFLAHPAATQ